MLSNSVVIINVIMLASFLFLGVFDLVRTHRILGYESLTLPTSAFLWCDLLFHVSLLLIPFVVSK